MDFQEEIKQLAGNIEMLKPHMQTEEATKNALIMLSFDFINFSGIINHASPKNIH